MGFDDKSRCFPLPAPAECWNWTREQLSGYQLQSFNDQLSKILPSNSFYQEKLGDVGPLKHLDELEQLPFTEKQELVASAGSTPDGLSKHHTWGVAEYSRVHRTSGTTGQPLMVMDTSNDWDWWSQTWQHVLRSADLQPADRVFMAFSFGPFIGFWSAHQACVDLGAVVIPGGGLSSLARLEFIRSSKANVMFCTPTYALHLAEVAESEDIDLGSLGIERIIVAGEAGGSLPAVRERLESLWRASILDHSGATEIGPWGFGRLDGVGLHIVETSFLPELVKTETVDALGTPLYELVISSLGRLGAPVIRYRTGDLVHAAAQSPTDCSFLWLPNGVVGRADSMVTVRGVNVFPSSIEELLKEISEIGEYRVTVSRMSHLDQLEISIETTGDEALVKEKLTQLLNVRLGLRIPVNVVPVGTLPRSEAKAKRWVDAR